MILKLRKSTQTFLLIYKAALRAEAENYSHTKIGQNGSTPQSHPYPNKAASGFDQASLSTCTLFKGLMRNPPFPRGLQALVQKGRKKA